MLNLNDIINVSFRKSNFSGYRTEDVDSFIDQVKDSYDQLLKKTMEQAEAYEALAVEKKELEKKLSVLAGKIEDYRLEESEIKNALVSAQKLGESSVREARHKAEIILKDANLKAERILGAAKSDVVEQQRELDDLKKKVVEFRTKLLAIYKEHLTLIDAIPSRKEEFSHEEKPAASVLDTEQQQEEESVSEAQHYMPEEPVVHSDPEPEYTPVSEKDDFAVDAAVFDTEFPSHDLRYDVLKFDEVDESGV